jgi:uncharacterized coiled-coil protein SlyX
MTDEVGNLILEHLRIIRPDVQEVKERTGRLEMRMSAMEDYMKGMFTQMVSLQHEVSGNSEDIRAIKRRLDLVEVE